MSQIPKQINYQGVLTDQNGNLLNGPFNMDFKLFTISTGGNQIWQETQNQVIITNGIFNVNLGSNQLLNIIFDTEYWLEVTINGSTLPRVKLVSCPYSLISQSIVDNAITNSKLTNDAVTTDKIFNGTILGEDLNQMGAVAGDVLTWSGSAWTPQIIQLDTSQWNSNGVNIFYNLGNVGIGTNAPSQKLDVAGSINISSNYGYRIGNNLVLQVNGTSNLAVGVQALSSVTYGSENTALGTYALNSNLSGYDNTASGFYALYTNSTGSENTALGSYALNSNNSGYDNTATGSYALYTNTSGYDNSASGSYALYYNTSGHNNSGQGKYTLFTNNTGYNNTASGYSALYSNTYGDDNTAAGKEALYNNTSGYNNTASGSRAMYNTTYGMNNTADGTTALFSDTYGYSNTAIGQSSLYGNTTGNDNTAIGGSSMSAITTQDNNTALGYYAGGPYTFSNSIHLGYFAYSNANGYTNVISIGYESRTSASNQARIGNSSVISIGGYAGWTNLSDGRYKKNITEDVVGLDFIMNLRPVTYNLDVSGLADFLKEDWGRDKDNNYTKLQPDSMTLASRTQKASIKQTGFIAQEVEAAAKKLGYDFSGVDAPKNEHDLYGLRYAEFVVPLVKAVQEQQKQIEILLKRIEKLEEMNNSQK